jgi:hypothetical protein
MLRELRVLLGGLELGFVFDAISIAETQVLAVQILKELGRGGDVVTVLPADEQATQLGQSGEDGEKVAVKQVIGLGSRPDLRDLASGMMEALGGEEGWLAKGTFVPNTPDVVPGGLKALDDALEKNKKGVSGVKVVIKLDE